MVSVAPGSWGVVSGTLLSMTLINNHIITLILIDFIIIAFIIHSSTFKTCSIPCTSWLYIAAAIHVSCGLLLTAIQITTSGTWCGDVARHILPWWTPLSPSGNCYHGKFKFGNVFINCLLLFFYIVYYRMLPFWYSASSQIRRHHFLLLFFWACAWDQPSSFLGCLLLSLTLAAPPSFQFLLYCLL